MVKRWGHERALEHTPRRGRYCSPCHPHMRAASAGLLSYLSAVTINSVNTRHKDASPFGNMGRSQEHLGGATQCEAPSWLPGTLINKMWAVLGSHGALEGSVCNLTVPDPYVHAHEVPSRTKGLKSRPVAVARGPAWPSSHRSP